VWTVNILLPPSVAFSILNGALFDFGADSLVLCLFVHAVLPRPSTLNRRQQSGNLRRIWAYDISFFVRSPELG
jgi:hypothetical protein